ncbi:hypothetical protein [Companilactobacillus bobalius]|uniref:Uncharacterized protein n=1 Tax=Companilactobacillus bobalius TaxID=2801451 RepID=A0A202F9E4_9LACO|nr:hypothetical protein [Companilactobacillus bobalius]GEO59261.1 hypothetical protein LBO01_23900 [Companilactobacillus paralimentarius]KAE9559578.1 hypothetical protein ATN92_11925 [Companilactobacillus bobalius]KAE9561505.1 hypothetical protein ATN92_05335 [Companilactobacillus bobalius]KAE9563581.1 hypothetical protein ATN92_02265 [Companilactobacillus bobalius]OVE97070.1 hypothetical protein LKACC16343_02080 [Companilactobacillus bobalius]
MVNKGDNKIFRRIKQDGPTCLIYEFVNGLKYVSGSRDENKELSQLAKNMLNFFTKEKKCSYVGEFFDSNVAVKALDDYYLKSNNEKSLLASEYSVNMKILDDDLVKNVNDLKNNEFILIQIIEKHTHFTNSHWLCIVQPKMNKHYIINSASATPLIQHDVKSIKLKRIEQKNLALVGKIFDWKYWKKMKKNRKYSNENIPDDKYEFKYVKPIKISINKLK